MKDERTQRICGGIAERAGAQVGEVEVVTVRASKRLVGRAEWRLAMQWREDELPPLRRYSQKIGLNKSIFVGNKANAGFSVT